MNVPGLHMQAGKHADHLLVGPPPVRISHLPGPSSVVPPEPCGPPSEPVPQTWPGQLLPTYEQARQGRTGWVGVTTRYIMRQALGAHVMRALLVLYHVCLYGDTPPS
jgi:hypothetical protein